jgi:ankyrin repeat protein
VNARDNIDSTPLFGAASVGRIDICKLLITCGADVNALNMRGSTPLNEATWRGYTNTCNFLISYGADVNAATVKGPTGLFKYIQDYGEHKSSQ